MIKKLYAVAVAVWLAGCAKPEPVVVRAAETCPPVPECRAEIGEIKTNADLLDGFIAYRAAFAQCRLYRDTLAACLHPDKEARP